MVLRFLLLLFAGCLGLSFASAQAIEELRVGVSKHNICVNDCDNANKEEGPNVSAEAVFASPRAFSRLAAPRPYAVASLNLGGDTSFAGVGVLWRFPLGDTWAIEPGLGYVIHSGDLQPPYPQGDPRNAPSDASRVYLGSRDLFRTSLAIGRDLSPRWGLQLQYEHLSHGQIIGSGRNQGMDTLGVRVRYRYAAN